MGGDDFGGGLWILVAINSAIFILFAASFFHPRTGRDWRVMGAYSDPYPRFEDVMGPLAAAREPQPQPAARLPWPRSWTGCAPARVATTPTPRFMTLIARQGRSFLAV